MGKIRLYTDGACSQNGTWNGGWAVVTTLENTYLGFWSGSEQDTTNNQMELTAFREALTYITKSNKADEYFIMTDSAYITNCFEQKWYVNWRKNNWKNAKKEPVANRWLWEDILGIYEGLIDQGYEVTIVKVKGHADNTFNNMADRLAVEASK
jgi:ribonuclease HI